MTRFFFIAVQPKDLRYNIVVVTYGQNVRNKTFNLTVILKSYSETQLTFLLVNDIPGSVMARSSLIGLENAHFEFIFFPDWSR